jgi:hypothetical protein
MGGFWLRIACVTQLRCIKLRCQTQSPESWARQADAADSVRITQHSPMACPWHCNAKVMKYIDGLCTAPIRLHSANLADYGSCYHRTPWHAVCLQQMADSHQHTFMFCPVRSQLVYGSHLDSAHKQYGEGCSREGVSLNHVPWPAAPATNDITHACTICVNAILYGCVCPVLSACALQAHRHAHTTLNCLSLTQPLYWHIR